MNEPEAPGDNEINDEINDEVFEKHVKQVEDRIFQRLLHSNENKLELLSMVAPKLAKLVDEESLQELNPTLINKELNKLIEDYVFECKAKANNDVSFEFVVLTAHQSSSERYMALRVLLNMVGLWGRDWLNRSPENPFKLRLIVPVLVYTGESRWRLKSLRDLVSEALKPLELDEELNNFLLEVTPDFKIPTLDLARLNFAELMERGTELACVFSGLGAQHSSEKVRNVVERLAKLITADKMETSKAIRVIRQLLQILMKQEGGDFDFASKTLQEALGKEEIKMLNKNSYAYEYLQKGVAKGVAQGIEKGRIESLRESIKGFISKLFPDAPEKETLKRLNNENSPTRLQFILNRAFDWQSYEDVWTLPDDQKD